MMPIKRYTSWTQTYVTKLKYLWYEGKWENTRLMQSSAHFLPYSMRPIGECNITTTKITRTTEPTTENTIGNFPAPPAEVFVLLNIKHNPLTFSFFKRFWSTRAGTYRLEKRLMFGVLAVSFTLRRRSCSRLQVFPIQFRSQTPWNQILFFCWHADQPNCQI